MKSPMITSLPEIPEKDRYTEVRILKSAAGWYLGTLYFEHEFDAWVPGSRDSEYFRTEADAERFLEHVKKAPNPNEYLRMEP